MLKEPFSAYQRKIERYERPKISVKRNIEKMEKRKELQPYLTALPSVKISVQVRHTEFDRQ